MDIAILSRVNHSSSHEMSKQVVSKKTLFIDGEITLFSIRGIKLQFVQHFCLFFAFCTAALGPTANFCGTYIYATKTGWWFQTAPQYKSQFTILIPYCSLIHHNPQITIHNIKSTNKILARSEHLSPFQAMPAFSRVLLG